MSLAINVEHLTKQYENQTVISDLTIQINVGEVIVFQGPSGVGKSTFLRCLTYLEPFQKGCIQVGNLELRPNMDIRKEKLVIQSVREQIGFVFQFFNLFPHLTVLENLMLAPQVVLNEERQKAMEYGIDLLKRVNLEHKAMSYTGTLSGGQKQRIAIARALAMRPKVMLFDEPTSSLDPEMKEEIAEVIANFAKDGLTILIVTHEPAFVERIATRVVKFGPQGAILSDQKKSKWNLWSNS